MNIVSAAYQTALSYYGSPVTMACGLACATMAADVAFHVFHKISQQESCSDDLTAAFVLASCATNIVPGTARIALVTLAIIYVEEGQEPEYLSARVLTKGFENAVVIWGTFVTMMYKMAKTPLSLLGLSKETVETLGFQTAAALAVAMTMTVGIRRNWLGVASRSQLLFQSIKLAAPLFLRG